jgi:hypothetical protein
LVNAPSTEKLQRKDRAGVQDKKGKGRAQLKKCGAHRKGSGEFTRIKLFGPKKIYNEGSSKRFRRFHYIFLILVEPFFYSTLIFLGKRSSM